MRSLFSCEFLSFLLWCVLAGLGVVGSARVPRQFLGSHEESPPCPLGFQRLAHLQGRYCYRHFQASAAWTDAWTYCKSINTELLTIADSAENQAVAAWIDNMTYPDKAIWLSGHDMLGQWTWAAQGGFGSWQPLPYSAWAPGQPLANPASDPASVATGSFRCLLSRHGQWEAASCGSSHAFVCKLEMDGLIG